MSLLTVTEKRRKESDDFPDIRLSIIERLRPKIQKSLQNSGVTHRVLNDAWARHLSTRLVQKGDLTVFKQTPNVSDVYSTLVHWAGETMTPELLGRISAYLAANYRQLLKGPSLPVKRDSIRGLVLVRLVKCEPDPKSRRPYVYTARVLAGPCWDRTFKFAVDSVGARRLAWKLSAINRRAGDPRPQDLVGLIAWASFSPEYHDSLKVMRIEGRPDTYVTGVNQRTMRDRRQQRQQRLLELSTQSQSEVSHADQDPT